MTKTLINIDSDVWNQAKAAARLKGITVEQLVEKILKKYLDEVGLNSVSKKLEELNNG